MESIRGDGGWRSNLRAAEQTTVEQIVVRSQRDGCAACDDLEHTRGHLRATHTTPLRDLRTVLTRRFGWSIDRDGCRVGRR
jgi:hypothetical protein